MYRLLLPAVFFVLAAAVPAAAQAQQPPAPAKPDSGRHGTPVVLDTLTARISEGTYELSAVEELPALINRRDVQRVIERVFPPALAQAGVRGEVVVRVRIEPNGTTRYATVTRSSGHPELDAAGLQVASAMRFRPARTNGRPVPVVVELPIHFRASQ